MPFPHDHEWIDGERQKEYLPPSPEYEFSLEPFIGIGLVAACGIGIVLIAVDDFTGVGDIDDYLIIPLSEGFYAGLGLMID